MPNNEKGFHFSGIHKSQITNLILQQTTTQSTTQTLQALYKRSTMAGSRVAHATLKGPSVVKELCIGLALGLTAGGLWKMYHWNEQRKVRQFYDLLEKGEISVVAAEE